MDRNQVLHLPETQHQKMPMKNPLARTTKRLVATGLLFFVMAVIPVSSLAQDNQEDLDDNPTTVSNEVMRLTTILTQDEHGNPLQFPTNLTAEDDEKEIYVINDGKKITIYDSNFFPQLAIGAGRGIDRPQCIFFDMTQGLLFVGQGIGRNKPGRLTILNAALLPEKEITFTGMPGADNFNPINGMIGKNGNIYLIGFEHSGVLVLNPQGHFSHWLKPMDKTGATPTETTSNQKKAEILAEQQGQNHPRENTTSSAPIGLPMELMPKSKNNIPQDKNKDKDKNPVQLSDIAIDSDGRIFLLSEKMSKVYAYGPGENFLFSFGLKGGAPGKMSRPKGLALDEKKKCIYIVDYMRQTILVFDMVGHYIFEFGGKGEAPMWYNFPTAIDVDSKGRIIIADLFNNRVQILESDFAIDYPTFGKTKDKPAGKKDKQP